MNKKKKDTIIVIAFLTWFFGSIIWMLYSFGIGQVHLGLALFAQYFIVLGLIAIFSKVKVGIVPVLVGTAVLAGVFLDAFGTEEFKNIFTQKVLVLVFAALLFAGTGIYFLIIRRYLIYRKSKRCTLPVIAECVNLKVKSDASDYHSKTKLYSPIWKYYFNGEYHTYCDNDFSNFGVSNVGDNIELFINPQKYDDIYLPKPISHNKFYDFLGVCALISSGITCYFLIIEILEIL